MLCNPVHINPIHQAHRQIFNLQAVLNARRFVEKRQPLKAAADDMQIIVWFLLLIGTNVVDYQATR